MQSSLGNWNKNKQCSSISIDNCKLNFSFGFALPKLSPSLRLGLLSVVGGRDWTTMLEEEYSRRWQKSVVSVPSSNLFDIVTVRCGHCSNLLSVNMAAAFQSLSWQDIQAPNYTSQDYRNIDLGSSSKCNNKMTMRPPIANTTQERAVNRTPEKRQRVPSAYNQFIKEEIQRIKANNPDISHREAFSTAAKNATQGRLFVVFSGSGCDGEVEKVEEVDGGGRGKVVAVDDEVEAGEVEGVVRMEVVMP
ncbi:hypothetical protein TEA_001882 [Camellia sinensis var. sinensis]|uniref:Uncharacterized protein n=1 Tax=Camellia sinensis var. sinensis TaxID=542762 RepID=A0A4S4DVE1_CAMSN|nr:hypothetical protein TEA_001882 [Camellia sinensis var. sinensis]